MLRTALGRLPFNYAQDRNMPNQVIGNPSNRMSIDKFTDFARKRDPILQKDHKTPNPNSPKQQMQLWPDLPASFVMLTMGFCGEVY
jgi:hypothetical protein